MDVCCCFIQSDAFLFPLLFSFKTDVSDPARVAPPASPAVKSAGRQEMVLWTRISLFLYFLFTLKPSAKRRRTWAFIVKVPSLCNVLVTCGSLDAPPPASTGVGVTSASASAVARGGGGGAPRRRAPPPAGGAFFTPDCFIHAPLCY